VQIIVSFLKRHDSDIIRSRSYWRLLALVLATVSPSFAKSS
jgi:hypothetical protein